ncbi:hypothetical protein K0M31_013510 [Melipona bicolor]|uniref:Uncharacterized protein n=1 Tax=Melipona bicolor TaxID=60889 RepID=A0AA40FHX9_9HYME|nr:hypothetical protein K0M31_013510 [Melipona bicolor]
MFRVEILRTKRRKVKHNLLCSVELDLEEQPDEKETRVDESRDEKGLCQPVFIGRAAG